MTWDWLKEAATLSENRIAYAIVTVASFSGSTPRETGAKMIVLRDGSIRGTVGGGNLERKAIEDALNCIAAKESKTIDYPLGASVGQCCGGKMQLLIEVMGTGPVLYIFGAGHVGQALCKTLVGTPFTVHLIDDRSEWITSKEIPAEVIRHPKEWHTFNDQASWEKDTTFAVVMTYQHDLDQTILEDILKRPAKFIGLIGSEAKWKRFQDRLSMKGISKGSFDRVQCPIGLPMGKAPQEVAISIAAALLKDYYATA